MFAKVDVGLVTAAVIAVGVVAGAGCSGGGGNLGGDDDCADPGCAADAAADAAGDAAAVDAPDAIGCQAELSCPPPQIGTVSVCGRLLDVEGDRPIAVPAATGARCTSVTPDGPCSLQVRFHDGLELAMNPFGAPPLEPPGGVYVDDCGRYRGTDIPAPSFGFVAVAVDDASGTADRHRLTMVMRPNREPMPRPMPAFATRRATDELWSGPVFDGLATFADRGVALLVFHHRRQPVAGVTVIHGDLQMPDQDFYFSDPDRRRTTVDTALAATGADGSALMLDLPAPAALSATGGAPDACQWPDRLVTTPPGAVVVVPFEAVTPTGAPCP